MTTGLLISRAHKNLLQKKSLVNPLQYHEYYKKYRNIYNSTLKISKQMYLDSNFKKFQKNPKKTWELLKETTILMK